MISLVTESRAGRRRFKLAELAHSGWQCRCTGTVQLAGHGVGRLAAPGPPPGGDFLWCNTETLAHIVGPSESCGPRAQGSTEFRVTGTGNVQLSEAALSP
jgi:hypothetical protein